MPRPLAAGIERVDVFTYHLHVGTIRQLIINIVSFNIFMAKKVKKSTTTKAKKVVKKVAKKQVTSSKSRSSRGGEVLGPLVPLHDRVVVRQLTEAETGTQNSFGIIIPDTVSKEKPEQGVVVATGPGKYDEDGERRIPMSVAPGDRIVFSKYGYDEVKVGGTEYFIVSEANILAIING
jgi:chaperonin GroES